MEVPEDALHVEGLAAAPGAFAARRGENPTGDRGGAERVVQHGSAVAARCAVNCDIIIATCGPEEWDDLAWSRAYPSARRALAGHTGQVIRFHEEYATVAQTRNAAALQSDAEFLCFLNAEDELDVCFLDEMESALDDYDDAHGSPLEFPLLASATQPHDPLGVRTGSPRLTHRMLPHDEVGPLCVGSLILRTVFMEVGGFPGLAAFSDWALWLRAVAAGCRIVDVPRAVYCRWEHHRSGLSFEERRQAWLAVRSSS